MLDGCDKFVCVHATVALPARLGRCAVVQHPSLILMSVHHVVCWVCWIHSLHGEMEVNASCCDAEMLSS